MSPSAEEFQVDSAALHGHAAEVDRIGDGLSTAAQAGEVIRTDIGAYGQLCQLVPALLNDLQLVMVDGMNSAAAAAHDTADALRSVAADYDTADTSASDRLRSIG
jgi:hypothetical protein